MTLRVVITGASSGIGRALATEYARRGATLGLIARRAELLVQLGADLKAPTALYVLDVRDAKGMGQAAADFCHQFGSPDVVIANAGVSAGTSTERSEDRVVFHAKEGRVDFASPLVLPERKLQYRLQFSECLLG